MKTAEIFKQYIWLADIIHRMKRLTLNEINERWMQTDMSGGLPMSRTTFNRHRLAIEEMFDLCIGCKESGRKYSHSHKNKGQSEYGKSIDCKVQEFLVVAYECF